MDPEPLAKNLTDDHLALLRGLPLTSLDLANCQKLCGAGFKHLRGMPLGRLGLADCTGLWDLDFMARLRELPLPLTDVDLHGCETFENLEFLIGLPLTSLRVTVNGNRHESDEDEPSSFADNPGPSALSFLSGMPLKRLAVKLESLREVFGEDLEPLKGLPELSSLTLETFSEITPGGFAALRELPNLAELSLRFDPVDDPSSSFEQMFQLPLTHLDLDRAWHLPDYSLEALREHTHPLTGLSLNGCPKLTDAGIVPLIARLPLTSLNLNRTKISDACLETLAGMPLTELDLGQCARASDAGLRHLAGLPLRTLSLGSCRQLTDAAVAHLRGLPLSDLNLSNCRLLTDGMLKELRGMHLRVLNVSSNKLVTTRGLLAEGFLGNKKQWQSRM